jgi:hypothetical protein
MMARHGILVLLARRPYPRPVCGIQHRRNVLQGTGLNAECVPLGCAYSRGPNAGGARARVGDFAQMSLNIKGQI